MEKYVIKFKSLAAKHYKKLQKNRALLNQVRELLEDLEKNPFITPPPFEWLQGNFKGLISRRLNIKDRLVYYVDIETKEIIIFNILSHYEDMR